MQRSIIGSIYGYLVCLLAIVIVVHSAAGFVSGIFGMASPGAGFGPHAPMMGTGVMRAERAPDYFFFRTPPEFDPNMRGKIDIRAGMAGAERVQAARVFVVSLVLGVFAVFLFLFHWRWLENPRPA